MEYLPIVHFLGSFNRQKRYFSHISSFCGQSFNPKPFQCIGSISSSTTKRLIHKYWCNVIGIAALIRIWWWWCEVKKTITVAFTRFHAESFKILQFMRLNFFKEVKPIWIWSGGHVISALRWPIRPNCTIYPIFRNQLHCRFPVVFANWTLFLMSNCLFFHDNFLLTP